VEYDPFSTAQLNWVKFTIKDRDNDWYSENCAVGQGFTCIFWYKWCSHIFPNHQFNHRNTVSLKRTLAYFNSCGDENKAKKLHLLTTLVIQCVK